MDYFIGSIIPWTPDYEPNGWFFCDGRKLTIMQYSAMFSLLGIKYGGDGVNTFALPNLCGRVAPGALTWKENGKMGGFEKSPVTPDQIPNHNHNLRGNVNGATPGKNYPDSTSGLGISKVALRSVNMYNQYNSSTSNMVNLIPETIVHTGEDVAHSNIQPYVALNYIICYAGIYPPRP